MKRGLLIVAAAIAALIALEFAIRYVAWPGEWIHPVNWFMTIQEDERASWTQAWFSVLAIAVAAGIGIHQASDARKVALDNAAGERRRQDQLRAAAVRTQMLNTSYMLMELAQLTERVVRSWEVIVAREGVAPTTVLGTEGKDAALMISTLTVNRPLSEYLGQPDLYVPEHLESILQADLAARTHDNSVRTMLTFISDGNVTVERILEWKAGRVEELNRAHRYAVEAIDAIASTQGFKTYTELFAVAE